jgi:4-amino-4-deoxy-L-arabinose transferase-like glycosyltransferase
MRSRDNPWEVWALPAILVLAAGLRLYHFGSPLLDGMSIKQVYVAHKARQIARPPFDLFRNDFDFLDHQGRRAVLTEEAPLFTGLMAALYSLFGEREWFGQAWSVLATLVGLAAFHGWVRREFDAGLASLATLLLALCPLLVFYGRAYQPDASMLACMLLACLAYRLHLDTRRFRWLAAAALAGAAGALFKYYALMVLLPLAFMAWRDRGWHGLASLRFAALVVGAVLPVGLWVGLVFLRTPNPARGGGYFLFQMPELLWQPTLYQRLVDRFLYRSCGPVTGLLAVAGAVAVVRRRVCVAPALGWTAAGLAFYFLLGPVARGHDYYELMGLPAAAVWAALGWRWLWGAAWSPGRGRGAWACCGAAALLAAGVLHSPLVMGGQFQADRGYTVLAGRLHELCGARERFVVAGPLEGVDIIHYARREAWSLQGPPKPGWGAEGIDHLRALGARYLAVYFGGQATPEERRALQSLAARFPVVEQRSGPWAPQGKDSAYYILSLDARGPAADLQQAAADETSHLPPG